MGLPVWESDAGTAQEEESGELDEPDWYQLYCQAIAAGIKPGEFGGLTYSQIVALIDAEKLRRYNDMYFNVSEIVSNMDDDNIRDALNDVRNNKGAQRSKLIQKMMLPYSPSFLMPDWSQRRKLEKAKPIEGLKPEVAEGIMQAIEQGIVTHEQWLSIHPIWDRILATANLLKQATPRN